MGILDDALNYQDGKRSQRLSQAARKAKIDSHKIKEGTYRGMDLTDGTARIQLDGQPNATSGYRLITNAPLGDGDRVSIRPNGVGLPRADARNVAPLSNNTFTFNAFFGDPRFPTNSAKKIATITSQSLKVTNFRLTGQPSVSGLGLTYLFVFSLSTLRENIAKANSSSVRYSWKAVLLFANQEDGFTYNDNGFINWVINGDIAIANYSTSITVASSIVWSDIFAVNYCAFSL